VHSYSGWWRVRDLGTTIHRYLFRVRRRPKLNPLLEALVLDTAELREMLELRCPFCGREFASRRSLARHLALSRWCKLQYASLLKDVAIAYRLIRSVVRRDNCRYYVRGCNWSLRDPLDACRTAKAVLNLRV